MFKGLEDSAEKRPFNIAVGKVGRAIVLAFRDQPVKWFNADLTLPFTKQAKGGAGLHNFIWLYNPLLSEWVARALDRNFTNAPAAFPPALQAFRFSPPAAKLKGTGWRMPCFGRRFLSSNSRKLLKDSTANGNLIGPELEA